MNYIKLEDAVKAVEALQPASLKPKGVGLVANITIAKAVAALRSLPTDDEVTDEILDKLDAWRFNVMLECQGGNGECVVGGAELNLNDLLAILDFVSDRRPLPAPPA